MSIPNPTFIGFCELEFDVPLTNDPIAANLGNAGHEMYLSCKRKLMDGNI